MARLTILEGPLGRFLNVYFLKSIMALYNFFFKKKRSCLVDLIARNNRLGKMERKKKKRSGSKLVFHFSFLEFF